MSSGRRRVEKRIVVGGALLLSMYMGVLAASVPGFAGSSSRDGSAPPAVAVRGDIAIRTSADEYAAAPTGTAGAPPQATSSPTPAPSATPHPRTPHNPPKQAQRPPTDPFRIYHVPVLMYHRIVPMSEAGNSAPSLVVSPEVFSAQMKAFSVAGWHSITMATLAADMETDTTIPPRTFVITFDDGWDDGYNDAFPIMRGYGFVGTFFVISSRIGRPGSMTKEQLQTLEAAGNEIGNHTENHTSLSTVPGYRVISEVETASREIAQAVGHRPVSLAYPMGGVTTYVAMLVGQIPDMKIAVTTGYGRTETWFQRYDTPRVRVGPSTDPARLLASLSL